MATEPVRLRVHIAPVGFEIDRITEPAIRMKSDRLWVVANKGKDQAEGFIEEIQRILSQEKIEIKSRTADIRDLYDVLHTMRMIIEEESNNDIFINVSSGTKIESIAGMLASSIFHNLTRITPYYVIPDHYTDDKPVVTRPISSGFRSILYLPDYHIARPRQELIDMLKIINDSQGGKISKRHLIETASDKKLIVAHGKHITQSLYASLNTNYLEKLKSLSLINEDKGRRSRTISITDAGRNMLKFLG
jgi:hypothetical protein